MAQLMPLPLTVSCLSKILIGFTFLVPAHPGRPRQRAIKRVCVCVFIVAGTAVVIIIVIIMRNVPATFANDETVQSNLSVSV